MGRRRHHLRLPLAVAAVLSAATVFVSAHRSADPNPFTDGTRLTLTVPLGGASVQVDIFEVGGRVVRHLVPEDGSGPVFYPAGVFKIPWDGRNQAGQEVITGVYFAVLRANGRIVEVVKLVKIAR